MRRLLVPCVAYLVNGCSWLIVAAMSVLKELTVTPDGTPGFERPPPDPPDVVLPQAAARRAAVPTMVSLPAFEIFWDPRPLTPSCKRIRALPSNRKPTVCDAIRSGSDERRHPTSVRQRPDGWSSEEGLSTPRTKNHPIGGFFMLSGHSPQFPGHRRGVLWVRSH